MLQEKPPSTKVVYVRRIRAMRLHMELSIMATSTGSAIADRIAVCGPWTAGRSFQRQSDRNTNSMLLITHPSCSSAED
jgi:hypothetical protein